ncbi:fidgetin-like protein 1 [Nematostella vectensis]|nr:fidgetin-like protein 1 [Nematostella vectensis]
MSFGTGGSELLNLWQRLQFGSESSDKAPSQQADSIRGQLAQLQHLQRSGKLSSSCYSQLFRKYADKYHSLVDQQDTNKGLNNFADPVLALVNGQRNESTEWKSSLSLEKVKNTARWKSMQAVNKASNKSGSDTVLNLHQHSNPPSKSSGRVEPAAVPQRSAGHTKRVLSDQAVPGIVPDTCRPVTQPLTHQAVPGIVPDTCRPVTQPLTHQAVPGIVPDTCRPVTQPLTHQAVPGIVPDTCRPVTQPLNHQAVPGIVPDTCRPVTQPLNHQVVPGIVFQSSALPSGQQEDQNARFANKRKAFNLYQKGSSFNDSHHAAKDPRTSTFPSKGVGNSTQLPMQRSHADYARNDDEEEDGKPQSFITAKQQYILDCKKQRGGRGGGGDSRGGAMYGRQGGYGGGSRRTLGTRRGPSSQFVPPVLNRDNDESGTRVPYGGGAVHAGRKGSDSGKAESITGDPVVDEKLKHLEPRMVDLIMSEIMDHGPPVTWDDIAGLEFAKNVIKEIVVWPMLRPDIFKGLRGPPKGLLLFGPPGTGKTLIGKCIASQSKATFFSISASSLTSKWVGEGEKMVRAMFAVARCYLPAVIFMDEIDSLLTQRTDGEHEASRRIKTEFLVQLDGATTASDERLLVVGATNRPQEIDEAARRRLVKRLYIPLPEDTARGQIIRNLLSQQNYQLTDAEIQQIVTRTKGYSGSDMSYLCREAALGPIRSIADIQHITAEQVRPILFCDFDAALSQVRASVSQQDLNVYTEWNRLFGSGSK